MTDFPRRALVPLGMGTASGLRLIAAAAVATAVVATLVEAAGRTSVNPFNFFGFFTVQSNIIGGVVLVLAAITPSGQLRRNAAINWMRGASTSYLVVVGLVYATLLAPLGAAGGVPLPWANAVLHMIIPVYVLADWVGGKDRRQLPWKSAWAVLVYPLAWCAIVLVRGATDGWVPYPFLDPASGYGTVATFVALIAVVVFIAACGIWWISRLPIVRWPRLARA
ncbi:MAG: hypothetical protein JWQ43_2605 [Glaciihabitans sp.]|nr:hypothetical protein [Glaciihabitans sp.]